MSYGYITDGASREWRSDYAGTKVQLVGPHIRTCLPKTIYRIGGVSSCTGAVKGNTHYKLAVVGKFAIANTDKGVVGLALAESRTVHVSREPAPRCEDARIECRLDKISTGLRGCILA